MWDVSGKAEKCRTGVSLAASAELSKGDTGNLGFNTPEVCQPTEGSVVDPGKHSE